MAQQALHQDGSPEVPTAWPATPFMRVMSLLLASSIHMFVSLCAFVLGPFCVLFPACMHACVNVYGESAPRACVLACIDIESNPCLILVASKCACKHMDMRGHVCVNFVTHPNFACTPEHHRRAVPGEAPQVVRAGREGRSPKVTTMPGQLCPQLQHTIVGEMLMQRVQGKVEAREREAQRRRRGVVR